MVVGKREITHLSGLGQKSEAHRPTGQNMPQKNLVHIGPSHLLPCTFWSGSFFKCILAQPGLGRFFEIKIGPALPMPEKTATIPLKKKPFSNIIMPFIPIFWSLQALTPKLKNKTEAFLAVFLELLGFSSDFIKSTRSSR